MPDRNADGGCRATSLTDPCPSAMLGGTRWDAQAVLAEAAMREATALERCLSEAPARAITRRRAIRIFAAAAGLPLMIAAVRAGAPGPQLFRWQGQVLDDVAELTLWHSDAALC